ncbi:receptor-type tyrosine-protein phosphatase-like N isoform X2 [Hemicordylus capensis]|uniref:receptor-type tyrosine-protein phosphatase-like N isoform X2 n=1 Tax=Hemicordylus capensis TaxID=884348 RepID=UPI002303590E|nr:receptor-type tyrosine-protein phosphatase-like N isoform X2 [Hemicordylus capensis]
MGRWWRLFRALGCSLILLLPFLWSGAAGDRPLQVLHGCLFDRRLCSQQEVCVQDGLFGQCQESSLRDRPYFQVTAPVLQRLQDVLQHLMAQGLSWQDDLTQYVISWEMERIPRLHLPLSWESVSEDRFPPIYVTPRKSSLPPEPASLQMARQPPLPPALLQRYLELLLASQPELTYKEALLSSHPHHQFSYAGGPLRDHPNARNPEPPLLLDRAAASRALFHASAAPSYRGQQGLDGGQVFQDLGALYLTQEQTGKSSTRAQHKQESRTDNLLQDYGDSFENGREPRTPLTESDKAVQKLTAVLASHGIRPEDLGSLVSLLQLQLLQSTGGLGPETVESKRVTEAEMQHGEELEPPLPSQESYVSAVPSEGQIQAQAETLGPTKAAMMTVSPEQPEPLPPGEGVTTRSEGQVVVMKKSHAALGGPGRDEERPEATLAAEEYGYIVTDQKPLSLAAGIRLLEILAEHVHLSTASFINFSVVGPALTFRLRQNHQNLSLADVANRAALVKPQLESEVGVKILQTGIGQRNEAATYPHPTHFGDTFRSVLLTFVLLACVAGIVIAAAVVFCLRQHAKQREKERLAGLGPEGAADSTFEYQELCRQHMAAKSLFGRAETPSAPAPAENSRVSSVSSQFSDAPQASPSSHSSTPSWCEEPVQSNMDISTGHMILAYMEDHLRNRDRLAKEWQALCAYQAEPNTCDAAQCEASIKKNRNPDYVPYDHARIKLKAESNPSRSDFINASPIIDHDPRMPAYIATQGPLSHTIADFWQMVWENGCTVIVMLSPLVEDGVKQCDRYWPDEGSSLYHIYEVNLVSEHIWCEDFLVRSFYLKNVQSQETRTLTQFHFLSWPAEGIPTTTRPLLDFRRKVNKCYRGRSCPIVVHCSDGAGRTGAYILIDMVLNRMAKGVKEIDIAATLEHVRDQRPGMVQTKDQFEFALTAVAEEVNAILKALPQ